MPHSRLSLATISRVRGRLRLRISDARDFEPSSARDPSTQAANFHAVADGFDGIDRIDGPVAAARMPRSDRQARRSDRRQRCPAPARARSRAFSAQSPVVVGLGPEQTTCIRLVDTVILGVRSHELDHHASEAIGNVDNERARAGDAYGPRGTHAPETRFGVLRTGQIPWPREPPAIVPRLRWKAHVRIKNPHG